MGLISTEKTSLEGVLIYRPQIFGDHRGFFLECYNRREYEKVGLYLEFVQDNHSKSQKGVLRGLHYQYPYPQGKLINVLKGSIYDTVVDIRIGSPTYGHYLGLILKASEHALLYVPIGFAHGFLVLEDETEVFYKVTDYYNPKCDAGIRWNDPIIGIQWPLNNYGIDIPILSEKDMIHPLISEIISPFSYKI